MTPLYQKDFFDYPTGMAIAVVLGILFGFVLERGGFGRAKVLVSDFYGDDLRVTKVMFTAVVTTAAGLGVLGGLGFVDLGMLVIPETFVGPHIVGGLLLGVGFVMSGYCPGTALVSAGSGFTDGIVALVGIMLGSLVFAFVYDPLADFYMMGDLGRLTFPQLLGVSWPVMGVAVTTLGIATFFGAEKLEQVMSKRHGVEAPDDSRRTRHTVFSGLIAVAALGILTLGLPASAVPASAADVTRRISPLELAQEIASGDAKVYVVDLRDAATCAHARIQGAVCLPADDADAHFIADLAPTRTLVLYGASDDVNVPASVTQYGAGVRLLSGGYHAFDAQMLRPPAQPSTTTPEAIAEYNLRSALHGYFTGSEAPAAPVVARPTTAATRHSRRGGGC